MSDTAFPAPSQRFRAGWLAALTMALAYVFVLLFEPGRFTPAALAAAVALGLVYILLALNYHRIVQRLGQRTGLVVFYAIAGLAVLGIQWLAPGSLWLAMLPLTVQAVLELPRAAWPGIALVAYILGFAAPIKLVGGGSWSDVLQASLQFAPALLFVVAFSGLLVRERDARAEGERLAAALGQANTRLREYAAQAEELATAKERNRLAREIHDTLGHYLTIINVQLEAAQAVMESDRDRAVAAVAKAQGLARDGLAEVRRSVAALRASPLESRPLPEVLSALADECRAGGLVVEYEVAGAPRRLPVPAEAALYRAAQEALTNVRKHARASRVDLRLDYAASAGVRLTVQDNGVGCQGAEDRAGRFGLVGMRERVRLLGGELRIQTAPGQGFRLEVDVPEKAAA